MSDLPAIWTVYDSPDDYPGKYVARLFADDGDGYQPTDSVIVTDDLETMRAILLAEMGLSCLTRHDDDDAKIVEVWL